MCRMLLWVLIILSISFSGCFAQKSNHQEQEIKNEISSVRLESVNLLQVDGVKWQIGQKVNAEVVSQSNVVVENGIFEISIGRLKGFRDGKTIIAWNDQTRLIYIETTNPTAKNINGIGIGSSRAEVLSALGEPFLKTTERYRYQNLEYEMQGIILYFVNNRVSRIICFASI